MRTGCDSLTSQVARLQAANLDVVSACQVDSPNLGDAHLVKTGSLQHRSVKLPPPVFKKASNQRGGYGWESLTSAYK